MEQKIRAGNKTLLVLLIVERVKSEVVQYWTRAAVVLGLVETCDCILNSKSFYVSEPTTRLFCQC